MINSIRHADFPSQFVKPRNVDVWLPPGYEQGSEAFPVLYMHDGQNLVHPEEAFIGETWQVAETMTRLVEEGKVPPTIIVGIWNTKKREPEYMPQKPYKWWRTDTWQDRIWGLFKGKIISDNYLQCLVTEIKPFIDTTFRTKPGLDHTSIMGSSMGGLISLYAMCEYPEVFNRAGCVSTAWPAIGRQFYPYIQAHLPDPAGRRIYFDYGTLGLDADYEPYQLDVDRIMESRGYQRGVSYTTHKFEGHDHNEKFWAERLHIPLEFLLGE